MPIAMNEKRLNKDEFRNENELQGFLEQCPYLLVSESEPKVASVQCEVNLPSAGRLDLLLVDDTGCPIAVEVKLSRNSQSRREVVAQAFDYVSDLSRITADELDDLVDGALEKTLTDFDSDPYLWKACATNLRAGIIKVIIAVDKANDDLVRIVRYINDHSDLDVRLVAISKFNNGEILVPNIIVEGNEARYLTNKRNTEKNPTFEQVIKAYNSKAKEELKTRNKARAYRQIRYNNWHWSLHYEFNDYKGSEQVGVELHLEADEVRHLGAVIKEFAGKKIGESTIEWDPKWSKKRGRISLKYSTNIEAATIAENMSKFIKLTRDAIDKNLP